MYGRSKNLCSLEVLPSWDAVIARGLLSLQSNVSMKLERKANNIGSDIIDVISGLPKTASKDSTVHNIKYMK